MAVVVPKPPKRSKPKQGDDRTGPAIHRSSPNLIARGPSDHRLAALVHEQDIAISDRDAAMNIIEDLRGREDGWETVVIAVVEYTRSTRRGRVRSVENRIIAGAGSRVREYTPGDGTVAAASPVQLLAVEQLRELQDQFIQIPGRGRVRGGEVKRAEWQERGDQYAAQEQNNAQHKALCYAVAAALRRMRVPTIDAALARKAA